ncbi:hypothetical protein PFICI_13059 [Pestalotiopsis fici W106-1]|uniref:FAD-binding domain-containing protein n=1 Tax=Pestalotiopsis fici (strain W106-1 / CGMCC3.15140) TaxID=1229662 RepID=W3WKX1_PESFW|nr:uncharacterized protein PFICI_13059 [Pestalotiopsis fici W106-1]ETS74575.1 hypothetical protein PFICI_13059 [Pestalotiopsis fici W106-1]
MTSNPSRHSVVIVGGGITGLALALMLQRQNVDYVLLEAYGSVTPNVGASIGLWPNGLRVLDQLGVYEDICAVAQPVDRSIVRDGKTGARLMTRKYGPVLKARHGYVNMFMERYELLRVLYRHVAEKDRILVNKKVVRIDSDDDKATIHTRDGSVFEAQIVVGADGVHSAVRKEMWRNADESDPAAIPKCDRENIRCEHACIFGTAKPQPDVKQGEVVGASTEGTTAGVMVGPKKELFTFWFWQLPEEMRSCPIDAIPRFDDEEKQRQLNRAANTIMSDSGLRFQQVSETLEYSVVTALPHFVLRRWHFGRLIVLGDAAHKFNPLVGQGGNSCIESCASLVNALQSTLKTQPSSRPDAWSITTLSSAFTAVEQQRVGRLVDMVDKCQEAMRNSAWETPTRRFMFKYIVPLFTLSQFVNFHSDLITAGVRLNDCEIRPKIHEWLYDDEQQEKQKAKRIDATRVITTVGLVTAAAAILLRNQHVVGQVLTKSKAVLSQS